MPQGATHLERLVERVYGLHEWSGAVLEVVGALKVEERDEEPHASALLAENHLALNLVSCSRWHTAHADAQWSVNTIGWSQWGEYISGWR